MKKAIIATLLLTLATSTVVSAKSNTRVATGTYYDYMCIETKDGNEWLLSDKQSKNNPYMKRKTILHNGKKKKVYVPRFKSGQLVEVKFNTMGTKTKKDDVIISVKKINK